MNLSTEQIHYSGNLGQQILQVYGGLAQTIRDNKTYALVHNSNATKNSSYVDGFDSIDYIADIFDTSNVISIDKKDFRKVSCWQFGIAKAIALNLSKLQEYLPLINSSCEISPDVVVYCPSTINSCLELSVYSNLLKYALGMHDNIYLLSDNENLLSELISKFSQYKLTAICADSDLIAWKYLLNAVYIYSIPNSLLLASKLFNVDCDINIMNPIDFSQLLPARNEYTFTVELKKYIEGVRLLPTLGHVNIESIAQLPIPERLTSSLCLYSAFYPRHLKFNEKDTSIASYTIEMLNSLPSDLKQIFISSSDNSTKKNTLNDRHHVNTNIYHYLHSLLEQFQVDNLNPATQFDDFSNLLISARKDYSGSLLSPILEELGFSLSKHFLFNYSYLLSRVAVLSRIKSQNYTLNLQKFISDGYLIINNFASQDILQQVNQLIKENSGTLSKTRDSLIFGRFKNSGIAKILASTEFIDFLSLLTGYSSGIIKNELMYNTFLQTVSIDRDSRKKDPQHKFHLDTFYPAFKFWYFPHAVSVDSGPFEYVKHSHLLSRSTLNHLQTCYLANAYDCAYAISPDHSEGSLRATDSDIIRMGLSSSLVNVPSNSLVVANVGGFHRRSITSNMVTRHAIHSSIRPKNILSRETYQKY